MVSDSRGQIPNMISLMKCFGSGIKVHHGQLKKDQELLNHQLQKAVLGRSGLNAKADIKSGIGHKARIVRQPVDTNAWHKVLSKEIAKSRKVRRDHVNTKVDSHLSPPFASPLLLSIHRSLLKCECCFHRKF